VENKTEYAPWLKDAVNLSPKYMKLIFSCAFTYVNVGLLKVKGCCLTF